MIRTLPWTAVLLLLLSIGGCRSMTPPVTYYTLNALPATNGETADSSNGRRIIGIRPVELPGYLNRLQMVTRSGSNELAVATFHRWADYLDRLVQQSLSENLQELLPDARVISAPWPMGMQPEIILSFQFLELVGTDAGEVVLNAVWVVNDTPPDGAARSYRTVMTVPIDGGGYDGLAKAHSRALERLSREVADSLGMRDQHG